MLKVVTVIFPEAVNVVVLSELLWLVLQVKLPELSLVSSRIDEFDHQSGAHKVHLKLDVFNPMLNQVELLRYARKHATELSEAADAVDQLFENPKVLPP